MGTKNNPGNYDCYANADPDEPMFVLLGRDRSAPSLVEAWADARAHNSPSVEEIRKIEEARACAESMRAWLERIGKQETRIASARLFGLCRELDIEMDGVNIPSSAAAILNAIRSTVAVMVILFCALTLTASSINAQTPASEWRNMARLWEYSATLWEARAFDCEGQSHPEVCAAETDLPCLQRWRIFKPQLETRCSALLPQESKAHEKGNTLSKGETVNTNRIGKGFIAAAILLAPLWIGAHQQPKPIEYKLSPEASKVIIQLEAQRKAFNEEINKSENYVFVGANVPNDSRQCGWDASGIVTCSKPKPDLPEAAKAQPSPRPD